jgi:hypothetical protein
LLLILKAKQNMKRSNLFLGLTTGLLALASFAFAKSNSKGSITQARCRTAAASQCPIFVKFGNHYVPSTQKVTCQGNQKTGTLVTTVACVVTLLVNAG